MSNRHRDKGRLPPFVPLLRETLQSAAWRAMSPSARVLYIALKDRYSIKLHNNGRIFLSVRSAAREAGLNKDTIARAFRELEHYGFIVQITGGCLGLDGKGKAPHWRLTELGYMTNPPTRDFLHWNGIKFPGSKNKSLSEGFGAGEAGEGDKSCKGCDHLRASSFSGCQFERLARGAIERAHPSLLG